MRSMRGARWMTLGAVAAMLAAPAVRAEPLPDPGTAGAQDAGKPGNRAVDDGKGGTEVQVEDQVFVTKALAGSKAEVELADLALSKTTNPSVKKFAEQMKQDHTGAQAMLAQAATREGVQQPETLDAHHHAMRTELAQLDGPEFDRRYMRHMVEDHEDDVALFSAKARTGDGDVAAIASRLTTVLHKHLEMAQEVSREVGNPATDPRTGRADTHTMP